MNKLNTGTKVLVGLVSALLGWVFVTFSIAWIEFNGLGSFLICAGLLLGGSLIVVLLGGGNPSSPDDEITVINQDGKTTRYTKKN